MTGGGIFGAGVIGLLLAVITFALGWATGLSLRHPRARGDPGSDILSDGAVLLVADGIVQQESPEAPALLGRTTGQNISDVLGQLLGSEAEAAINAVTRLEEQGDSFALLLRTRNDAAIEIKGAPAGALIRLIFRDAQHIDTHLRAAEARMQAAEAALHKGSFEQEALRTLIAEGPIIAWHREASGQLLWSAGRIKTAAGVATPEEVINMTLTRAKLREQPAISGNIEKARIEILTGDRTEKISVHVVEIVREDGSRIGFGTDAGSAAMAERRLARFVQTMTETFAHLTVGLAIFDRNQSLALFNPALVQMWNLEPSWLAQRPSLRDILDELRALRRLPEPEDFHSWRADLLELFENPESAEYEEVWHLADGSNIRVLARPHPHGALAFTFDDVTERMRLEQRYRHSIDLRRATLDGLSEGIVVFGPNGLVQFSNATFDEIWRMEPARADGTMHARQLIDHCEAIAPAPDLWQRLHGFITGEESRHSWSARLGTVSGRALNARFAPLPDGSTLGVFHDISETERIADRLANREAAIEVADRAREAVQGMIAEAGALASLPERSPNSRSRANRRGNSNSARNAESAGVIGPEAEHHPGSSSAGLAGEKALRLLEDAAAIAAQPLLPFLEDSDADPLAMLDFAAAILAPRAAAKGVKIVVHAPEKPTRLHCPSGRLAQVALLLAEDALRHAAKGARIVLCIEGDEGEAEFALAARISAALEGSASNTPKRLDKMVALEGGHMRRGEVKPGKALSLACHFGAIKDVPPAEALRANKVIEGN